MAKARGARTPRPKTASDELEIALRIVVEAPPHGVLFCIQGRPAEFFDATRSTGADLVFDTSLRVSGELASGAPRLLGRVVQGPPEQRFLYVCSGTYAGQAHTPWSRRAKVPLAGITSASIAKASKGGRLEARIAGTARDGGPACATVPLLAGGWRCVR